MKSIAFAIWAAQFNYHALHFSRCLTNTDNTGNICIIPDNTRNGNGSCRKINKVKCRMRLVFEAKLATKPR